jgi:tRNA pseudouridine(55) synthase
MPYMQAQDKVYEATVRLGERTDTQDPTGTLLERRDASSIGDGQAMDVLRGFLGKRKQTVPLFSSARVDGKHLYEYAREGEEVEQPQKDVEIFAIDLLSSGEAPNGCRDLRLRVHCGAGTYVRALADELGAVLGVGGHLAALRRTRTGALDIAGAITVEAIVEQAAAWQTEREDSDEAVPFDADASSQRWTAFFGAALVPVQAALGGVPAIALPDALVARVLTGNPVRKGELDSHGARLDAAFRPGDRVVLSYPDGVRAAALARAMAARDALPRFAPDAIVFEVERVLR